MTLMRWFFLAGVSSFTVTSRIAFAMARDGAFPGSTAIRYVSPLTKSPVGSVALVCAVDLILLLLPLATIDVPQAAIYGPIAFNAVTSITVIGYQMSYAIPIFLRVTYKRSSFSKTDFNNGPFSLLLGWCGTRRSRHSGSHVGAAQPGAPH